MADDTFQPRSETFVPRTPPLPDRPAETPRPGPATTPAERTSVRGWWAHFWGHSEPTVRQSDSGREVVETVVFVVVLVLLLKSFAAEAFVIPTGSMAVTLWGYQKVIECPKCHHQVIVNCADEVDPQDGRGPSHVSTCVCENCRYLITLDWTEYTRDGPAIHHPGEVPDPGANSGDRVLVAKFLYDGPLAAAPFLGRELLVFLILAGSALAGGLFAGLLLRVLLRRFQELARRPAITYPVRLLGGAAVAAVVGVLLLGGGNAWAAASPSRLDVVVFKYPNEPQKNYTPMNYIKRLIGLSRETIGIHGGKIYILPASESPQYDDHADPRNLWRSEYTHNNMVNLRNGLGDLISDPEVLKLFKGGKFHILQKPPAQQLALRRPVYFLDQSASDLRPEYVRWEGDHDGGVWQAENAGGQHGFRAGKSGTTEAWLRYHHRLRTGQVSSQGQVQPELITDFMSYNTGNGQYSGQNWASDLMLECEVTVDDPTGSLVLELSRGKDRYRARWDLASGKCTLTQVGRDGEKPLREGQTALMGKGTHLVRFSDFDDRLTVWVDHQLPFGDGVNTTSSPRVPNAQNDLQPASVGVVGGPAVSIRKLNLWRDTYYTVTPKGPDYDVSNVRWGDPSTWPSENQLPIRTMYVQPGHYLCLGDNSPASSDSREWGLVPERLMLGRALLIYYPFGLFGSSNRAGRIE